jgi:hypothetical protein
VSRFIYYYAKCHYAECRYAEFHYAECRGAINTLANGSSQVVVQSSHNPEVHGLSPATYPFAGTRRERRM